MEETNYKVFIDESKLLKSFSDFEQELITTMSHFNVLTKEFNTSKDVSVELTNDFTRELTALYVVWTQLEKFGQKSKMACESLEKFGVKERLIYCSAECYKNQKHCKECENRSAIVSYK